MTKSWGLSWGNNNSENGLVKPPRRKTRALIPAGVIGGKSPLRLAAQKSSHTRHQRIYAVRLLKFFENWEYKVD
jgi:hypothetical protein